MTYAKSFAGRSSAQEIAGRFVFGESVALAALCSIDIYWTIFAIESGFAREANPLMALFLRHSVLLFCLVKVLTLCLGISAVELLRSKNPGFARRTIRWALFGFLFFYVVGSVQANHLF